MSEMYPKDDYCANCGAVHGYMSGPCEMCGGTVFSPSPTRFTITPEEFETKMVSLVDENDEEVGHMKMDELMCELLNQLGYEKGVEVFQKAKKWYA